MTWVRRCRRACLLSGIWLAGLVACNAAAAAPSVPGAAWQILLSPEEGKYSTILTNIGSVATSGTITLSETLPAESVVDGAIEARSVDGGSWEECTVGQASPIVVTCKDSHPVPALGQSAVLVVPTAVDKAGVATDTVVVSGGGAPTARAASSIMAGGSSLPFEFLDFNSQASDVSGALDNQAGGHPYALTTTFALSPGQTAKSTEVELPTGLFGDPQATSKCTIAAVFARDCPASSRVGTFFANFAQGIFSQEHSASPIYNVVPERGYPAEFGFFAEGLEKTVFLYARLGAGPDYNLRLSAPDLPVDGDVRSAVVTFFGDPIGADSLPGLNKDQSVPFITNSSDCSARGLETKIRVATWREPNNPEAATDSAEAAPVAGCNRLQFHPTISVEPENTVADELSGYTFDVKLSSVSGAWPGRSLLPAREEHHRHTAGGCLSFSVGRGRSACVSGRRSRRDRTHLDGAGTLPAHLPDRGRGSVDPSTCRIATRSGVHCAAGMRGSRTGRVRRS